MSHPEKPDQPEATRVKVAEPAPAAPAAFWRWLAAGLLLLGVALTVFFALHAVRSFRTFDAERGRPPREATGDIAPWMTIPYIAAAYQVPADFLYSQLGIDAQGNDRKSLMQLERSYFKGERGVLRARILAALDLYYAGSAVPTPIVPDPASIPIPDAPPPDAPHPGPGGDARAPNPVNGPDQPPTQAAPAAAPATGGEQP